MQRRGKLDKDGGSGGSKKGKDGKSASSSTGGNEKGNGGGKGGKENYEGADSVASHEDRYVDSDDEDELIFDPMDDVASDETSETGGQASSVPPHPMALDLRGMPMQPLHPAAMSNQHSGVPQMALPNHGGTAHYGNPAVPAAVESLHSANPIDKLYLMQDSYFTQM